MGERLSAVADHDDDAAVAVLEPEMDATTDRASRDLVAGILRDPRSAADEIIRFRQGFERRLRDRWEPAISLFDTIQVLATGFGSQFNDRYGERAATRQDYAFEALTRIHGRACLTAAEVGALLRAGFATGAMTRWRTLHELAIVAVFISDQSGEVARRYLEHDMIERERGARLHQTFAEQLGDPPFDQGELDELRTARDELVQRYGTAFKEQYGWAAEALGKPRPTFTDIAEAVDMDHWRPYIRMASHGVHAGPHGGYWDIGFHPDLEGIPAGASHFGLADPATHSLMALAQVTTALLVHGMSHSDLMDEPDWTDTFVAHLLTVTQLKTLQDLTDEAAAMFVMIQEDAEDVAPALRPPPRLWRSPDLH